MAALDGESRIGARAGRRAAATRCWRHMLVTGSFGCVWTVRGASIHLSFHNNKAANAAKKRRDLTDGEVALIINSQSGADDCNI
jgi:hypothetical protein